MLQNRIAIGGKDRSSAEFGLDYIEEFRRVILAHARPRAGAFLEWGSGHTTKALAEMREELGVRLLCTIDSDRDYLMAVLAGVPKWPGLRAYCRDVTGPRRSMCDPELAYSTLPLSWKQTFDVIFIDGRRRMECALVASLLCHEDSVVLLHDYRRARYQVARAFYDIVEDGPQFRVMRPKPALLDARPPWHELTTALPDPGADARFGRGPRPKKPGPRPSPG